MKVYVRKWVPEGWVEEELEVDIARGLWFGDGRLKGIVPTPYVHLDELRVKQVFEHPTEKGCLVVYCVKEGDV